MGAELQTCLFGAIAHEPHAGIDACRDVDRLFIELDLAELDLGNVEHVVDQVQQVLAAVADIGGIFDVARIAQLAEDLRRS